MSSGAARRAILGLSATVPRRSFNIFPKPLSPRTPSNPPIVSPSSLATSSETTLEDFPHIPTSDPIIASLNYATDTELIDALLAEPPSSLPSSTTPRGSRAQGRLPSGRRYVSPYKIDWKSSIDPAFAFLALRTRSTFGRFIDYIRPRVRQVYTALRPSGMHQLFASDVMIRSGDVHVIRDILEIDGEQKKQFRSSMTVSMYEHIRPSLDSGRLSPLSGKTNRAVSRALMVEGSIDHLPRIFEDMYKTVEWSESQSSDFFQVILYMARHERTDEALSMLARLVSDGRMPEASRSRSDPTHPKAKTVLVQTMIIRASLQYKRFDRVQQAADDLFTTIEGTQSTTFIADLILELCRTSIVGRRPDEISWVGSFLQRYAKLDHSPPLPSAIINAFIDNTPRHIAVNWYANLSSNHQPPSAQNIIRLAHFRPRKSFLTALLGDVAKLPESEFIAQQGQFLHAMIRAKERDVVEALYKEWKGTFEMTPKLVVAMVKLLTEDKELRNQYKWVVGRATRHYKDLPEGSSASATARALTLTRIYLLRDEAHQISREGILTEVELDDLEIGMYIQAVTEEDPIEAYRLVHFLNEKASLKVDLPVKAIIETCLSGNWNALDQLKTIGISESEGGEDVYLSPVQARLVQVLRSLRLGRIGPAMASIAEMEQKKESVPVHLYRATITRALSINRFDLAISTWSVLHNKVELLSPQEQLSLRWIGISILRVLRAALSSNIDDHDVDEQEVEHALQVTASPAWSEFGEKWTSIEVVNLEWDQQQEIDEIENREKTRLLWNNVQDIVSAARDRPVRARSFG